MTSSTHPTTTKTEALEYFMRLSIDDVRVRAADQLWSWGSSWTGLLRLMERKDYGYVRDIGADAAAAWAGQLGLLRR